VQAGRKLRRLLNPLNKKRSKAGPTPVIPALGRQMQEGLDFEASLGYTVRHYLKKQTLKKRMREEGVSSQGCFLFCTPSGVDMFSSQQCILTALWTQEW
jgi:hypothetical protein